MGILIDDQTHMIVTCDHCHDPILTLDDGMYVDLGEGKGLFLHSPMGGPCMQDWIESHPGSHNLYHLPMFVGRLAATYGADWLAVSQRGQDA